MKKTANKVYTALTVILIVIGASVASNGVYSTPTPAPGKAVFGRTLFPTPPPMVHKRTSLSAEGEFINRQIPIKTTSSWKASSQPATDRCYFVEQAD